MQKDITLTLIANAGVLVEYAGTRLLIDGIHHNTDLPFDGLPDETLGPMLSGNGPLADIDYLLFTHSHPDHFSKTLTMSYLQNNNVKGFVFGGESATAQEVADHAGSMGIDCITPKLQNGRAQTHIITKDSTMLTITVAAFAHMGAQYAHRQSYTLGIDCGGHRLLFTGDSQPDPATAKSIADKLSCDTMLVNPLYYIDPKGREMIDLLRPNSLLIYHLPKGDTAYKSAVERANRHHKAKAQEQGQGQEQERAHGHTLQFFEMGDKITLTAQAEI